MRVLLIDEPQVADASHGAEARLRDAGHDVVRCRDQHTHGYLCDGMPGGAGCPLERSAVDVALSIRGGSSDAVGSWGEEGVRCALRRHVPLVAAGAVAGAPWSEMATVVEPDLGGVADAVEEAAAMPLLRHGALAGAELRAVMDRAGMDPGEAHAVAHRCGDRIRVELRPGVALSGSVAQAAAVRVASTLRESDRASAGMDVVLAPEGAPVPSGPQPSFPR